MRSDLDDDDDMDGYTGHRELERRERIEALADHIGAILNDLFGPTKMPARYCQRDLSMLLAEIGIDVGELKARINSESK